MRQLDWDRVPDRRIQGPKIVPMSEIVVDPALIVERDVKRYVNAPSTQDWYFEPITTVELENGKFEANGYYAHSMVEACQRLGYETLQIVWMSYVDWSYLNRGRM